MTTIQPSTAAISATGLSKSYGDKVVLDGIDLDVPEGTVFALLGPNGAGKTTVVHILTTLIRADAGHAHIAGHDVVDDPQAVRGVIGVTGQFAAVDGLRTGGENLTLMAVPSSTTPRCSTRSCRSGRTSTTSTDPTAVSATPPTTG